MHNENSRERYILRRLRSPLLSLNPTATSGFAWKYRNVASSAHARKTSQNVFKTPNFLLIHEPKLKQSENIVKTTVRIKNNFYHTRYN